MIVDFTFTTSGTRVRFQNLSEDLPEVVKYLWNFGDGNTSSEKNPTHKYRCAGNYEVVLTIQDYISGANLGSKTYDLGTQCFKDSEDRRECKISYLYFKI